MKKSEIKTFLPVFTGFYNTIWQYDYDNIFDGVNNERKNKNLKEIDFDLLKIDYEQYENDIAIALCDILKELLKDYVNNITFENIYNPKTYNFSTDSINCIIEPKKDNISKFIYEHKKDFIEYLKQNYTSCDGFWSHYSNNFQDWAENTENFTDFSKNSHYLGSILQFIFNMLDYDILNDIYYDIKDCVCEYEYIENYEDCINFKICDDCGSFIQNENIIKDLKKYYNIMGKYPSKIVCENCLETLTSV